MQCKVALVVVLLLVASNLILVESAYSQIPSRYISPTGRMSTYYILSVYSPNDQLTYNSTLPLNFTLNWYYDLMPIGNLNLTADYAYRIDDNSFVSITPNNASSNDRYASQTTFIWNPSFFYTIDISNLHSGNHNFTIRAIFYFAGVFLNDISTPFIFTVHSTLNPTPIMPPFQSPQPSPTISIPTATPSTLPTSTTTLSPTNSPTQQPTIIPTQKMTSDPFANQPNKNTPIVITAIVVITILTITGMIVYFKKNKK